MTDQQPENSGYLQPPVKKGSFWKIATAVVFIALVITTIFTFFTNKSGEESPEASLETAVNLTDQQTNDDPEFDADGDGLSASQEELYGTNPNDSDTDKDGFSDGEEVKNGYNPNGAGRLSIEAEAGSPSNEDPNRATASGAPEMSGVDLQQVFSGKGAYQCSIEGGTQQTNTVTVKVLDNKVRQETPVNDSVLVMIIHDQKTLYLSGFQGGKYLKLSLNESTGVASGQGATIRGGIFVNPNLILATNPTSIACEEAVLAADEFELSEDDLVKVE